MAPVTEPNSETSPGPPDAGRAQGAAAALMAPIHWVGGVLRSLYHWVIHWADTPYGTPALAVISFAESSFFPIPPDVLQIALSVGRPKRSFLYAAVSAAASVAGGVLGFYIGRLFWDAVSWIFFGYVPGFTVENFEYVQKQYHENAMFAIFAAAFTPIPYKVFTIAAGVFQVPLTTLLIASAAGRSARFFLVATCIYLFGPTVKNLLEKYFELATVILAVLFVGGFMAVKYLVH